MEATLLGIPEMALSQEYRRPAKKFPGRPCGFRAGGDPACYACPGDSTAVN